eukprot:m.137358 g.137358  ORF g.137358 m.137358 type:complete len:60 (+) comp23988_c0_seq1:586-765(+)
MAVVLPGLNPGTEINRGTRVSRSKFACLQYSDFSPKLQPCYTKHHKPGNNKSNIKIRSV